MFDIESFLIPLDKKRTLLISDTDWGLEELEGLLVTLGGDPCEKIKIPLRKIDPGTYIGAGKLEELAALMEQQNIEVLLVDFDLSPSQVKNIEKVIKKLVLDRTGVILEIFSRHAKTKESKLQVSLARLQYVMPRLAHLWSHFERQRGSGGASLKGKGMGEKQIEVDRRLIKERMYALQKKLKEVEGVRSLHRKKRETLLKVAIVGYTNAGKSTLLNALTCSDVLVEDALFATLDASVRLLNPKSRPAVLAIDTVGFIDRLPHDLVASFRSTLKSVLEADLLVHVLDSSHPEVKRHFEVTMKVLQELEAEKIPMLIVFNKMDKCCDIPLIKVWGASLARLEDFTIVDAPQFVSALNIKDVNLLRDKILKFFEKDMQTYEVLIPFEDGKMVSKIYEVGRIEKKNDTETGTFFRFKTTPELASQLNLDRFKI